MRCGQIASAPQHILADSYYRALLQAGGLPMPIPIPLHEDEADLLQIAQHMDGLLLAGGGDVAAHFYGARDGGMLTYVDERRDRAELTLTRWALAHSVPTLAICRGIQVLNVAAGGTLVQDIPSAWPSPLVHSTKPDLGRAHIAHTVRVRASTRLAVALSGGSDDAMLEAVAVNSFHHQCVGSVAPGMVATAWAGDGVVEGLEPAAPEAGWTVGVQWHPEEMVPADPLMARLFAAFVAACCSLAEQSRSATPH
jgi:putative glutamine amidotransferase